MQYGAELADPLVDVRDVLESFRTYGVTPVDWRDTLRGAAAALDELSPKAQLNQLLPGLVIHLNQLLADGLTNHMKIVEDVADQVAVVLRSVEIPDLPKPQDPDWSF